MLLIALLVTQLHSFIVLTKSISDSSKDSTRPSGQSTFISTPKFLSGAPLSTQWLISKITPCPSWLLKESGHVYLTMSPTLTNQLHLKFRPVNHISSSGKYIPPSIYLPRGNDSTGNSSVTTNYIN